MMANTAALISNPTISRHLIIRLQSQTPLKAGCSRCVEQVLYSQPCHQHSPKHWWPAQDAPVRSGQQCPRKAADAIYGRELAGWLQKGSQAASATSQGRQGWRCWQLY
jgi:hypothetical protein